MEIDHESILQTFLAETEENLAGTEEALVTLETHPDDEEALGIIFRAIHTLKGDATSFGFQRVSEFAHAMENVLDRLRCGETPVTGEAVSLLLGCVDILRRMVPAAASGADETPPEMASMIGQLGALRTASAPPPSGGFTALHGHRGRRPAHASVTSHAKTLRIDTSKLDRMLNLITELTVARGRLGQMLEAGSSSRADLLEAHRTADGLHRDLQELVMRARMVPVETMFRSYIRIVRDLARENGKLARLVIEAPGVEVDTRIIEHMRDPLTHMIRNAIAHGIESPGERAERGKDPSGRITLRAHHEAASIVIQVSDDGVGLSRARIADRARAMGLALGEGKTADHDIYRLILEPGFSTVDSVSTMSGRGVGMDIVRRNVEAVRGSLSIDSVEGEGCSITIRLPLTLAIIDGFGVGVGDETYVIPLDAVIECVELPEEERDNPAGVGMLSLRGQVLPYVRLRRLLKLGGSAITRESVVVVHYEGGIAGITVDTLYGESQTVIKPLGRLLDSIPGISGSAILGNGRVALILDVPVMLRRGLLTGSGLAIGDSDGVS